MPQPSVLITGCSQGGIGDALAREFASRGHRVFATVRDPRKATHLADLPGVEVVTLDVTSSGSIADLAAELRPRFAEGGLDILVNNAGIGATGPLIETDLEELKKVYDVNVVGLLAVTQAFIPMLRAARGRVVNISSVGGLTVMPWGGPYHSSKAAVTMLSEILRLELAPLGVTVVTAMLGAIESNFHANDSWTGLADSSIYKGVEAQVAKVAAGEVGPKKEKTADVARRLVEDILGGASGQIWRGAMAQTMRVLGYHAPTSLMDRMILAGSGLDTMAREASKDRDDQR